MPVNLNNRLVFPIIITGRQGYAQARGNDGEWEGMDEDSDNGGSDDDDDGDDDAGNDSDDGDVMIVTINDKRKNRLKTENEKFFDDL